MHDGKGRGDGSALRRAAVTLPFELHGNALGDDGARHARSRGDADTDSWEAGHFSAIDTHEMRMFRGAPSWSVASLLEAPHMIADIGAR